MPIRSSKRRLIIIVLIQNIFSRLADLHPKTTARKQRREKQLDGRAVVGPVKK